MRPQFISTHDTWVHLTPSILTTFLKLFEMEDVSPLQDFRLVCASSVGFALLYLRLIKCCPVRDTYAFHPHLIFTG